MTHLNPSNKYVPMFQNPECCISSDSLWMHEGSIANNNNLRTSCGVFSILHHDNAAREIYDIRMIPHRLFPGDYSSDHS